jgi:hypothetical protein
VTRDGIATKRFRKVTRCSETSVLTVIVTSSPESRYVVDKAISEAEPRMLSSGALATT